MTKGSSRRRARAESASHVEAAERFLRSGKNEEALKSLLKAASLAGDDADILARLGVAFLANGRVRQAIDTLRRSIALRPDVGEVLYHLGVALQLSGDADSAIDAMREASRLSPGHADAHGRLGELLFQRGRRAEAAAAYEKAAAIDVATPRARFHEVMAHMSTDQYAQAEEVLRQMLAKDPSNGKALQMLGAVLQFAGKNREAETLFERAIQIDPNNAIAYSGLVSTRKFVETDRPWLARMLSQLETMQGPPSVSPLELERKRMTLHFALGKVYDDLGSYAEAMSQFDAANRIRHRMASFNREAMERRTSRLMARFTPEFFAKSRALGHDDRTPILIVGLPRSGTSLLERILSSHPEVRGCGELDYWNDLGPIWAFAEPAALAEAAGELQDGYMVRLRGGATDVGSNVMRATDKMPFNFYWLGLAHLLFPNATIVHSRRNPIDACLSIYQTRFEMVWDFASSLGDLASYYRIYSRLMDHWRKVIPSNRMIEVDYEAMVGEPESTARALVAFAGLAWNDACLHPERNPQGVATASQWQARQPIYRSSVERWRHYEPWLGELRQLLSSA